MIQRTWHTSLASPGPKCYDEANPLSYVHMHRPNLLNLTMVTVLQVVVASQMFFAHLQPVCPRMQAPIPMLQATHVQD